MPRILKKEMAAVQYASSGKIGLQFKRRFWEEDDQIFGGISRTDQEITQIVYPSHGYLGRKGVLIGYYQSGARAAEMAARTPAEREALALAQGKLIHPQYETEFECSFSVSWQNVQYNEGAWAQMTPEVRKTLFPRLLEPDRRMYFAGDHCSNLTAWMCGALESGRFARPRFTGARRPRRSSKGGGMMRRRSDCGVVRGPAPRRRRWRASPSSERSHRPRRRASVTFYGSPTGTISSGVVIPAGRASVWISGTTPPVLKADAPAGSRERFGDTKTQAAGILKTIETQLAAQGLTMKDVVYIRAYLVRRPGARGQARHGRVERGLSGRVRHGRPIPPRRPDPRSVSSAREPGVADRDRSVCRVPVKIRRVTFT